MIETFTNNSKTTPNSYIRMKYFSQTLQIKLEFQSLRWLNQEFSRYTERTQTQNLTHLTQAKKLLIV